MLVPNGHSKSWKTVRVFCHLHVLKNNKWLTLFIAETRNQNGDQYPPRTIYAILSGILHYMRSENSEYPNFLDKNDAAFATFQTTIVKSIFIMLLSLLIALLLFGLPLPLLAAIIQEILSKKRTLMNKKKLIWLFYLIVDCNVNNSIQC